MNRPSLDEYDTGSYLDGALALRHEPLYAAVPLCRACSYKLAQAIGFEAPVTMMTTYQPGLPLEAEEVLVWRQNGEIRSVASYSYGRAYFEPGEPRAAPCEQCGAETLVDA